MNSFYLRSIVLAVILAAAGCSSGNRPPQNVTDDTRVRLAKALLASGDPVNAAEAMRTPEARANSQAPDDLMNAQLLIAVGKVDAGMDVAKAALAARGDDPNFGLAVAGLAVRSNRLAEADTIYRGILRLHPFNVEAMNGEAVVLAQEGNLADATTLLRQALARRPDDVPARSNLALVLLLSGQSAAISAPQEFGHATPPPRVETMPIAAPERHDGTGAGSSRPVASPPTRLSEETPALAPEGTPVSVQSATPAVPSPPTSAALLVEPSSDTQIAPPPASRDTLPRTDSSDPWSCPNICQLMHSVFDRKTDGQAAH